MSTPEEIQDQVELLSIHRRTLSILLKQLAFQGSINVNSGLIHSIHEARGNILRIKSILRSWNVHIADHLNDEDNKVISYNSTEGECIDPNVEPINVHIDRSNISTGGDLHVGHKYNYSSNIHYHMLSDVVPGDIRDFSELNVIMKSTENSIMDIILRGRLEIITCMVS